MGEVLAGVCLALAAAATEGSTAPPPVFVPGRAFTLAWTHSIEKTRWEEDYALGDQAFSADPGQGAADSGLRLVAVAARVRGSGAGMEPPQGAVRRDGWYHYRPATPPLQELMLTRSVYTADYQWCQRGACRPMADLLPSDGGVTRLWPCRDPRSPVPAPIRPAG